MGRIIEGLVKNSTTTKDTKSHEGRRRVHRAAGVPAEAGGIPETYSKNKEAGLVHPAVSFFVVPGERLGSTSPQISIVYSPNFFSTAAPAWQHAPSVTAYITKARFSSSCCKTGSAQPDISTRLAASIAA